MHRLYRDSKAPRCLSRYRHGVAVWTINSPNNAERAEIWDKLHAMQGLRCAYCERAIQAGAREIEHFRQRRSHPQGTFEWNNLFGACREQGTCGDHKDKSGSYDPAVLIKPDEEDPDDFLVFAPDGSVSQRAKLATSRSHRAAETIRIMNLNGVKGALRFERRREVIGYVQTAESFAELASQFSEDEWLPLLQEEIKKTAHLPFATAIRHVLTRVHAND